MIKKLLSKISTVEKKKQAQEKILLKAQEGLLKIDNELKTLKSLKKEYEKIDKKINECLNNSVKKEKENVNGKEN